MTDLSKPTLTEHDADGRADENANLSQAEQDSARPARRGLLALGSLALSAFVSACGQSGFTGSATTVRRVTKKAASPGEGDGQGADGGATGEGGEGTDGSGQNVSNDGAGGAGGTGSDGSKENPTQDPIEALPPCDPEGLQNLPLSKITTDASLIQPSIAEGVKIWGRQKSALIAISLKKTIELGSTIVLTVPSVDGPMGARVIASRTILNLEVDIMGGSALVTFDNLNLSGITKLVLVVIPPMGMPSKIEIDDKTTDFHPQSKRFATRFKDKPVIDAQLSALEDSEGLAANLSKFGASSPIFGGEDNGFGFSRDTTSAFRAVNIRTAGYFTKVDDSETAHVAHALTNWQFPAKFKQAGAIVTDLLERDVSAKFSGATTTALKDDYTFVVYVPDNATSPTVYFRSIISVG